MPGKKQFDGCVYFVIWVGGGVIIMLLIWMLIQIFG